MVNKTFWTFWTAVGNVLLVNHCWLEVLWLHIPKTVWLSWRSASKRASTSWWKVILRYPTILKTQSDSGLYRIAGLANYMEWRQWNGGKSTQTYNILARVSSLVYTYVSEYCLDWLEAPVYPSWWQITWASVIPNWMSSQMLPHWLL